MSNDYSIKLYPIDESHFTRGGLFDEGTIAINATNCSIIKIPKTPVELRIGKIVTWITLKTRGKRLEDN